MKQLFGVSSNQMVLAQHPIDSLIGVAGSPFEGIVFDQSNQNLNWYIDNLTPAPEAEIPFYEYDYGNVSVMFDGSAGYGHKAFYLSYALAELLDTDALNSRNNALLNILEFFNLLDEAYLLAAFKSDKIAGAPPLEVQFTDLSLSDPDYPLISWQWDFNGDGIIDSQEQHPAWTFTEPGAHTITLTVGNALASNTITKTGFIMVNDGCLVYEGKPNGDGYSGTFIKSFLEESTLWASTYSNILPEDINGYKAVFLSFGNFDSENTILDDNMADIISNYLQNGGYVYIDGGDPFGWDQVNNNIFLGLFGIDSAMDGTTNPIDLLEGQQASITNGITFTSSSQPAFGYIDIFVPSHKGQSAFIESDYGIVAVQNTGIFDQRTFCFSYSLANLIDGEDPNTRTELLLRICDFFDIPTTTSVIEATGIVNAPDDIAVYPNPVSGRLTLSCHLNTAETVQVSIINIHGQEMEWIKDKLLPSGDYQITRNIAHYPPGIYFCRLQIGNKTITKKIVKR
jgi:PKD repeat protein